MGLGSGIGLWLWVHRGGREREELCAFQLPGLYTALM